MERFWSNSIFKYLRVEPEDHYFLLTEPVGSRLPFPGVGSISFANSSICSPSTLPRTAKIPLKLCSSLSTVLVYTSQYKLFWHLRLPGLPPKSQIDR